MTDWKARLNRILSPDAGPHETPATEPEEWRGELSAFFENTVLPAFYELKEALQEHGREVQVEKGANHAAITVLHNGEEEFSYAIRGQAYHKMSFAFPAISDGKVSPWVTYATVSSPEAPHQERRVKRFTKQRVIDDFIDDYARWRGW